MPRQSLTLPHLTAPPLLRIGGAEEPVPNSPFQFVWGFLQVMEFSVAILILILFVFYNMISLRQCLACH